MLNITILDGYTTNPGDLSWEGLSALGNLRVFDRTPSEKVLERAADAEILLTNKVVIDERIMENLPALQLISVLATGYNVVDVVSAKRREIAVCNVRGYASESVAQHVFALLLELTNRVGAHNEHVGQGGWSASDDWSYTLNPVVGLASKTMGIYGLGKIGQRVADIALAFGMEVLANHKHPERDRRPGVRFVTLEEMFRLCDVVSLHAPLTPENEGMVNRSTLSRMKAGAFLINTGRGGLVKEDDLRWALENGVIAGAGLDVLSTEPPVGGNVLIGAKNCVITPHQAWASKEARAKLIEETVENVKAFLAGNARNKVW
jgi:glycerate dehydrogenase